MNKKNYISLAKKSANIQINELKKIKKVFNNSFVDAVSINGNNNIIPNANPRAQDISMFLANLISYFIIY